MPAGAVKQSGKYSAALLAVLFAGVITANVAGCSSSPKRPVLYPNQHLNRVGGPVSQQDIDACMRLARSSGVNVTKDGEVGRKAASGAALGGVSTGVYGAVRGSSDVGNRALAGAAAGAATGAVRGGIQSTEQSPLFMKFVNKCLSEKGYSVIGWQ
jgi:outer membrane lipoprotein SlyB